MDGSSSGTADAFVAGDRAALVPPMVAAAAERFVGRLWALEQVADWLDGTERFFVLAGEPGSGKSTFAAWLAGAGPAPQSPGVARVLQTVRGSWDAVHFCTLRAGGGSVDPRRFTESLARQLADRYDDFALAAVHSVAPEYNIHLDVRENWGQVVGIRTQSLIVTGASPADAYAVAVREPLWTVLGAQPQRRVHILVDGLDEALTPARPNIVTLLASSGDLPDHVRFLCTTRDEHRVLDLLADRFHDIRRLNLSGSAVAGRNQEDIRAHVIRRLREAPIRGQANNGGSVADDLVRQADGNFLYVEVLLDEVAAGRRRLGDVSGLPRGLPSLYRAYLDRIMPEMERYGASDAWLNYYRPLLGSLSVAVPAAPSTLLPRWLRWDEGEVLARIEDLNQIFEFDPNDGGGYRVFHQSLADFLATDRYRENGDERINRYYVSPRQQHDRLVHYYLTNLRGAWEGSWSRCDPYGLRQLPRHMEARLRLTDDPEEQRGFAEELYALVLDPGFQAAQRQRLGGVAATAEGIRAAVEVALDRDDLAWSERLLEALAAAPAIELRGLGVEGLVKLHARHPDRAIGLVKRLLGLESSDAWGVGLKAAYMIGAEAMEVFRFAVLEGSPALRRAVVYALYLWWRRQPFGLTLEVLNDLASRVSLRSPMRTRRALEFMADLSITIYINHCDRPEIVAQGNELWTDVFKHRLHLDKLNLTALMPLLSPIMANAYTKRVVDTWLFVELQDPSRFFVAPAEDKARFRRVITLLEPSSDPLHYEADLGSLLRADVLLFRFTAAMALGVHAYKDFPGVRAMLVRLFDRGDGDARLWELLAFAILLPDTPAAWVDLLEELTTRFVTENRATFMSGGTDVGRGFDFALLPLGLSYGKRGGSMPWFEGALREGLERGDHPLVGRIVEGLGLVGFYYPHAVFRTLQPFLAELKRSELVPSLVAALATVRVLYFDAVDLFLHQEGLERLQLTVSASSEMELVRRYVAWVGFLNNGVHLSLHYPRMRRRLLMQALKTLADSRDTRDFVRRHMPVQFAMLRDADYELARWTLPE